MLTKRPYKVCTYCKGLTIVQGILAPRECLACTNGVMCKTCPSPVKQTTLQVDGKGQWGVLDCEVCEWIAEI